MADTISAALSQMTLPDAEGREVRLGSLWEKGPAVVVFLRHYGWIFCREHIVQLRDHEKEFREAGATLAAIGLGDRDYAKEFQRESGIDFPLLIDEKRLAYRAARLKSASILHLVRFDNFTALKRARAAGHRQHRLGQNPFQLGGSFVFAPGNADRFVHLSQTFGDNASPEVLLGVVRGGSDRLG